MFRRFFILMVVCISAVSFVLAGCGKKSESSETKPAQEESHEGHDHGSHEGHDHSSHEGHNH